MSAPLRRRGWDAHPHLTARFDVRMLGGANRARVDVIVGMTEPTRPHRENYHLISHILVGGNQVYTKAASPIRAGALARDVLLGRRRGVRCAKIRPTS